MKLFKKKTIQRLFSAFFKIRKEQPDSDFFPPEVIPATIEGTLFISLYNISNNDINRESGGKKSLTLHRHKWVNGSNYNGMQDNDLRGFLDGRYRYAWNQPGQIHVRPGRRKQRGESELFRVLQRWSNIALPPKSDVLSAQLEIDVEYGTERKLDILLYEVLKDWNPGEGGIQKNNNSIPALGEVWWNEAMHNIKSWGLPGVGFASDTHPESDTPIAPLALARYSPNDSTITFKSKSLASYIQKCINQKKPLLFLIKLSDYLEDIPGSRIKLFSGDYGDNHNSSRRPRLILDWKSSTEIAFLKKDILLEYGRALTIPKLPDVRFDNKTGLAISFTPKDNNELPLISVREKKENSKNHWYPINLPVITDFKSLEIKVSANIDPITLGEYFTAELHDTWIESGSPENQKVTWIFLSPTGRKYIKLAQYVDNYTWRVRFKPAELGRWQYRSSQSFTKLPHESTIAIFDVIPGSRNNMIKALKQLIQEIKSSNYSDNEVKFRYESVFNRFQRTIISFETPDTFLKNYSPEDGELGKLLDEVRKVLFGIRSQKSPFNIED